MEKGGPEKQQRYCGNCGAHVDPQASYCTSCGERLVPEGRHLTLVEDRSTPREAPTSGVHEAPKEVPAIEGVGSEIQRRTLDLLAAYNETLGLYGRLPHVVWVRKSQGFLGRFLLVPRWRLPLRYFLVHHVATTLTLLKRHFYADMAISGDSEVSRVERDVVENFLQTLPPIPYKRLILGLSLPIFLLASLMFGSRQDAILNKVPPAAWEGVTSPWTILGPEESAVRALFTAASDDPTSAIIVSLTLLILFWVALTVVVSGFRLKRVLFNLYPLETEGLLTTSDADHRVRSEGVYELEAKLFAELGMSPHYEPPFDLLVGVPIRILSLLGASIVTLGGLIYFYLAGEVQNDLFLRGLFYTLAVLLVVVGVPVLVGSIVALVRGVHTWRRRRARLRELWETDG